MKDHLEKKLHEKFLKLPEELQKIVSSEEFEKTLSAITESHPLQDYQQVSLENEVLFVMIGLESPNNLITNIKHHAKISRDRSEKIVGMIEKKILIPNKEILEKAFGNKKVELINKKTRPSDGDMGPKQSQEKPHHDYVADPYRESPE